MVGYRKKRMAQSRIIPAIKRALPSVVTIRTAGAESDRDTYAIPVEPPGTSEGEKGVPIGGSGFVVARHGIIATNKHVVPDPQERYEVLLQDGTAYPASVVARDPTTDIAFLKIPRRNLHALALGNARRLALGETVVAIGNAFGQFTNTVSAGIVSGLSRSLTATLDAQGAVEELEGLIQTDAAINPGNSGGPLINLRGEAIGINIATVLGAQGLGFAIPIDIVKRDLDDLKRFKRIRRGYLGIRYIPLTNAVASEFGLSIKKGAFVISDAMRPAVDPESPAARAGIREWDVVIAANGKTITEKEPLAAILARAAIDKPIRLDLLRGKRRLRISITPAEWRSQDVTAVRSSL